MLNIEIINLRQVSFRLFMFDKLEISFLTFTSAIKINSVVLKAPETIQASRECGIEGFKLPLKWTNVESYSLKQQKV